MDYAGAVMWCDLVVGPARRASGRQKWLLVWDNHKSHLDEEVITIFAAAGIILRGLPVNMSDLLQGYPRQQLRATLYQFIFITTHLITHSYGYHFQWAN